MHNEPAYSKLIYEYFVLRFQFQYYAANSVYRP